MFIFAYHNRLTKGRKLRENVSLNPPPPHLPAEKLYQIKLRNFWIAGQNPFNMLQRSEIIISLTF
jgi:hypothetical protein